MVSYVKVLSQRIPQLFDKSILTLMRGIGFGSWVLEKILLINTTIWYCFR